MQKNKLVVWLEVAAGFSVLVGLLLVAQELRQNNQYARAESVRDLFQMWQGVYEFEAVNGIELIMGKAAVLPDELTDEEIYLIEDYLTLVMNAELTQATMEKDGYLVTGDIVDFAPLVAKEYFSTPIGRAWLRLNEDWITSFAPEYFDALIHEIETTPVETTDEYLEDLRSGALQEKTK